MIADGLSNLYTFMKIIIFILLRQQSSTQNIVIKVKIKA